MADAAQRRIDPDASRLIAGQSGGRQKPGPTTPVAHSAVATSRKLPSDSASLPSAHAPACHAAGQLDAGVHQRSARDGPRMGWCGRQRLRRVAHQDDPRPFPVAPRQRERQFGATCAAADNGNARAGLQFCLQCRQSRQELPDRLDRHARSKRNQRRSADIDRQQVERHGRASGHGDAARGQVDVRRLCQDQSRTRAGGKRRQVDVRLVERVFAADQAGQHAGVGRLRLAADQRQPNAGFRAHGEPAQHLDVRVAGAQQDEVGGDRHRLLHGAEPSPLAASCRSGKDTHMIRSRRASDALVVIPAGMTMTGRSRRVSA